VGRLESLVSDCIVLDDEYVPVLANFVQSTWFVDRFPVAPYLSVVGLPESVETTLLRLLSLVGRRSLLLADSFEAKVISLLEPPDDPALNSRCILVPMFESKSTTRVPTDEPRIQPQAAHLRAQLLTLRLENYSRIDRQSKLTRPGRRLTRLEKVTVVNVVNVQTCNNCSECDMANGMKRTKTSISRW